MHANMNGKKLSVILFFCGILLLGEVAFKGGIVNKRDSFSALRDEDGLDSKKITILFVRHGRTIANQQGILMGRGADSPLLEEAWEEAKELGKELQDREVDYLYSSSLGRTKRTLLGICQGANWEYRYKEISEFDDISWGQAEGYTAKEFMQKNGYTTMPEAFGEVCDEEYVSPIGAESSYEFCVRFNEGVCNIYENSESGDTILCVVHNSLAIWVEYMFGKRITVDNLETVELVVDDKAMRLYCIDKENTERLIVYSTERNFYSHRRSGDGENCKNLY